MILLCYDGSADAEAAADIAARLFPGAAATVISVWEPYAQLLFQNGFGLAFTAPVADVESIDAAVERQAQETATAGAARLQAAGMRASAQARAMGLSVAETIIAAADELDAEVLVVGTRGRGNVRSALLGSVSHAVLQHATRPVLVAPSAAVAAARAPAPQAG